VVAYCEEGSLPWIKANLLRLPVSERYSHSTAIFFQIDIILNLDRFLFILDQVEQVQIAEIADGREDCRPEWRPLDGVYAFSEIGLK